MTIGMIKKKENSLHNDKIIHIGLAWL